MGKTKEVVMGETVKEGLKKVYSETQLGSNDPKLIEHCELLIVLYEADAKEGYRTAFKQICDNLRKVINTNNVISLDINKEKTEVLISIFDVESIDGNYYDLYYDEDKRKRYILVS